MVALKRFYDEPEPGDGTRVLVERLWPRGLSKERAHIDVWLKEIAPSRELRTWFGHDPEKFTEFRRRYEAELAAETGQAALAQLQQALLLDARKGHAHFWKSLVCAFLGRDEEAVANLVRAKTAELPLPQALFAPLSWLEQKRPDFYRAYAVPVLANP